MRSDVAVPFLTAFHPKVDGEGQLDPLGLVPTSDRLANAILPDITARMRRPRFLTAMVVGCVVTQGLGDRFAAGDVEPYLVFEWYLVEAIARHTAARTEETRNFPGTDKARAAVAAGEPLHLGNYLSTPTVFGFHGIYRRLAAGLGICDEMLRPGEAGFRLLRCWEQDNGLDGFGNEDLRDGAGPQLRAMLRDAVAEGLRQGQTARSAGWAGWQRLFETLRPNAAGTRERGLIRRLLLEERPGLQAEFAGLVRKADIEDPRRAALDERRLFRKFRDQASPEMKAALRAIETFEDVSGHLDDAWRLILSLSAEQPAVPIGADAFAQSLPPERGPRSLSAAIGKATQALAGTDAARPFELLVEPFLGLETPEQLFAAVVRHHRRVQEHKPPDGKRPWIEAVGKGVVVRSAYRDVAAPTYDGAFVNQYRTAAVYSLLADLR